MQVSYSSQSARFGNSSINKQLFRTIPTFHGIQYVLLELIRLYYWKQVYILTEEINIHYRVSFACQLGYCNQVDAFFVLLH